jgi:hypothetical protein
VRPATWTRQPVHRGRCRPRGVAPLVALEPHDAIGDSSSWRHGHTGSRHQIACHLVTPCALWRRVPRRHAHPRRRAIRLDLLEPVAEHAHGLRSLRHLVVAKGFAGGKDLVVTAANPKPARPHRSQTVRWVGRLVQHAVQTP